MDPTSPKPYIPPSEQKVLEPRKYTGCNIPGRSFKILQAITEPENYGWYNLYILSIKIILMNNISQNFTKQFVDRQCDSTYFRIGHK